MIGGMQGHQNGDAAWHREQRLSEMQQTLIDHGEIQKALCEQIEKLTKQRDELLAAAREVLDDAEECRDSDDWTAMLVSLDAFHNLDTAYDAIAIVEEGS